VGVACKDDPTTPASDAGVQDAGGHDVDVPAAGSGGSGGRAGSAGSAGKAGAGGKAGTGGKAGAAGGTAGGAAEISIERATIKADEMPKIDDSAYGALIAQLNQFGLELGRRQAESNELKQKNCVYSPLSASIALSMTYAGARTTTATELSTLLSGGMPADTYHAGINRLARELASRAQDDKDAAGNPRKIELNIADAVYLDKQLAVMPDFLDQLARNYDSGVHRTDFRHAFEDARMQINDWVADETHDKIQNLLQQGALNEMTRLVLVNALYFYGSWLSTFNPMATNDADFHTLANSTVSVPTMLRQGGLRHSAGTDYTAVELPYVGGHLSMLIVLPNDGKFESVRKAVSADWLKSALDAAQSKTVRLALPKFKMTVGAFSLTQSLEDMGLKTAFSDKADLTGISSDEPLQISSVVQKAFISVDENGTEAAAATAVSVGTTSLPAEIIEMNVDRPFLFFIRDDNGAVLFSGHVVDPSKSE
jgi:serpin B